MSERTLTPGPWTPGGYLYSSDGPTRMNIWAPRAKPEHQSGPCVARDVLECDVPLICAVHDLVIALQAVLVDGHASAAILQQVHAALAKAKAS